MSQKIRIDFVSDVSCSWCAVGMNSLENALAKFGDEVEFDLHFHPFELNPEMVAGGQNLVENLVEKYGLNEQQAKDMLADISRRGEAVGFDFQFNNSSRIYNTFDTHRILHWAGLHGKQKELKQALFTAHFTENADPGDHELLVRLADSVGLDTEEAQRILASDEYAQVVRDEERKWMRSGVTGVPTMVFDNRYALNGARSSAAYEQVIRQALSESSAQDQDKA
ncbi:DsbA family oxidoreductase [Priestia megaterium]